jgi:ADP-dependent NAD(P)H-hydrate dehydratase / NAD(P)H-hydrate epimerase
LNPLPVLTHDELRAIETRAAREPGPTLMEKAGAASADAARRLCEDTGAPILVVAGPGNNGGDAWVAAAHLLETFHRVVVLDVPSGKLRSVEAQAAQSAFRSRNGEIVTQWPERLRPALVVDGLLGIGLARNVEGEFADIIRHINALGAPVLALDIPSGLDSETGVTRDVAVQARATISFIAAKLGLYTADGPDHCGRVEVDSLGIPPEAFDRALGALLTPGAVKDWVSPRPRGAHKGNFGAVGVIGGTRGMVGAALLAARASLMTGAGKVYTGLLSSDAPTVDIVHPELMLRSVDDAMTADVLVVGPGAGRSHSATSVSMFERSVLPAAIASPKPLVLDADALNALAFNDALAESLAARKQGPTILTPHPAEAARLLKCETATVQSDRLSAALGIAIKYSAHVVLKGAGSICVLPDGRWSVNATGNAGLATGGTGDVLAGMIGALLAQGLRGERALQYAVCLHGAAADACVARGDGPAGLTATEVMLEARRLMNAWSAASAA